MRGNRGARAQQLFAEDPYFLLLLRQLRKKPDHSRGISLGAIPEFLRQTPIHLFKIEIAKQKTEIHFNFRFLFSTFPVSPKSKQ